MTLEGTRLVDMARPMPAEDAQEEYRMKPEAQNWRW